jgi:hypothetical protein
MVHLLSPSNRKLKKVFPGCRLVTSPFYSNLTATKVSAASRQDFKLTVAATSQVRTPAMLLLLNVGNVGRLGQHPVA